MKKKEENYKMTVGIRSWLAKKNVCVEITDNGTGIPEEDIQKIMLPFYTTKDSGKGTGLGLSICYQILKEMKATMEIKSYLSKGTTIKIILVV